MLDFAPVVIVSSRQNAIVRTFRTLARSRGAGERRVLLEGPHLVEAARESGWPITVAAFSSAALDSHPRDFARLASRLEAGGTRVLRVSEPVMAAMSPVRTPAGLVAIAECVPVTLERVFARAPQLVLIAVDLQDPGNLGAMMRAAEAGGATGIITSGATADPFGWKALRGAMGSAFRLPVVTQQNAVAAIAAARRYGLRVLGTAPRSGRALYDADFRGPTAVLVGGEGSGLPPDVIDQTDETVSIPMDPAVESLNVAVTAALVVYEAFRQRST